MEMYLILVNVYITAEGMTTVNSPTYSYWQTFNFFLFLSLTNYTTNSVSVFIKLQQYFSRVETSIKFLVQRIYGFLIELGIVKLPSYCIESYSYKQSSGETLFSLTFTSIISPDC